MTLPSAIVIAGPTASGKSALALAVARAFGGHVINADSMQVYQGLQVITAGPTRADQSLAPHHLYECLDPARACSAALWRNMAEECMRSVWNQGGLPVLVGGTGLYLKTLIQGISPIPDIPPAIREQTRALLEEMGNACFHAHLAERDPVMAARLDPGNSQRLARAWEVLEATGQSLAHWQAQPRQGAVAANFLTIALLPPRDILNARCADRFQTMVANGALEEVGALMARRLDPALPAMKALGVPELAAHLAGQCDLESAVMRANASTRAYAKRQMTWFRHQMESPHRFDAQFSESLCGEIFALIRQFLLTR